MFSNTAFGENILIIPCAANPREGEAVNIVELRN